MWRGGTGGAALRADSWHRLFWLALRGHRRATRGDGVPGGVLGELGELPKSQWWRLLGEGCGG